MPSGTSRAYVPQHNTPPRTVDTAAPSARRTQLILKNGGKWMPPQTIWALADSQMSDADLVATVKAIRASTVKGLHARGIKADDGFKYLYDDPVLEKRTSAALALKRYLSGAIGPWPIQDEDLHHIQRNLQQHGYGKNLKVNGAWDGSWDAAYRQYTHTLITSQLAGNNTGSTTVGNALHWLSAVLPKEAGNAIIGFAKSLPGAGRQLAADVAGGLAFGGAVAANTGRAVATTVTGGVDTSKQGAARGIGYRDILEESGNFDVAANTATRNLLGAHTTQQEVYRSIHQHPVGEVADDVGTMLLLHSAMKTGARLSLSIGEGLLKRGATDLTLAEAQQAAGTAGRTVAFRGLLGDAASAAEGTPALRQPGAIARTVGRIAESRAVQNVPGLARVGAGVGRLADADGAYYKWRTLAASPYRVAAVARAGETVSEAGLLGAKVRAGAALTQAAGGNVLAPVSREDVLDHVDDAVANRLDFTVLGHHVTPHLDDVAWFLHGPTTGAHAASNRFGDDVETVRQNLVDSIGEVGIEAQAHRATGLGTDEMIGALGGEKRYAQFMGHKWNEYAAALEAESTVNRQLFETGEHLTFREKAARIRAEEHKVWLDEDRLATARRNLLGQGDEQFALRMKEEITHSRLSPKGWLQGNGSRFLDASEIVRTKIGPWATDPQNFLSTATREQQAEGARVGLARLDTLTYGDANNIVTGFEQRANDLRGRLFEARKAQNILRSGGEVEPTELQRIIDNVPTPDDMHALEDEIGDHLHLQHGVLADYMPHDLDGKIDRAREFARDLAHDIYPADTDVTAIADAFDQLRALGYKPVFGTDIGWMHVPATRLDVFDGDLTRRRRLIEAIGLNPDSYSSLHIGAHRRIGIKNAIQDLVDAGKVRLPRWWTTDTVWAYLRQEGVLDQPEKGLAGRLTRIPKGAAAARAEAEGISKVDAAARIRAEITGALQLRDIGRSHAIEVLTDPGGFERFAEGAKNAERRARAAATGVEELRVAPFTRREAELVYRAIVKGSAAPKSYLLGLSRIDDLGRASFGFAGAPFASRGPGDIGAVEKAAYAVANLPNRLVQLRNEFRFELSPWFSFRRVAKTNVKLAAEGVAPTLRPLDAMERAGTLAEDRATLDRIYPQLHNDVSDAADRYLRENDVFGFYNARNYEAYAAGTWKRAGKTDDEIKTLITKTFAYGSRAGEGRTALERSANFVFFPFSFEKTLYRNMGGYLLDRPGQLLLLTRALEAYHQFNENHLDGSNPLASAWWEKHVPLLQEAERLNAFSHGVSAGEFGGINRPLLNVFLPQAWSSSPNNLATLQRFIPAVKDLSRVMSETRQQGEIVYGALDAFKRKMMGDKLSFTDARPSTLSSDAQLEEAYALQRELYDAPDLAPYLQYNAHHPKNRYKFGKEWGDFAGEDVTKENLRRIIARRYPAYDPEKATIGAVLGEQDVKDYLFSVKDTSDGKYAADLVDLAQRWGRAFDNGTVSPKQLARATADFRRRAAYLARKDPAFYSLYQKHLRRLLGPLEAVN